MSQTYPAAAAVTAAWCLAQEAEHVAREERQKAFLGRMVEQHRLGLRFPGAVWTDDGFHGHDGEHTIVARIGRYRIAIADVPLFMDDKERYPWALVSLTLGPRGPDENVLVRAEVRPCPDAARRATVIEVGLDLVFDRLVADANTLRTALTGVSG